MASPQRTLSHDPTAHMEWHRPDSRFIPIRADELLAALAGDTTRFGPDAGRLTELGSAVRDVIEQETCTLRDRLDRIYAVFNPDRDTKPVEDPAAVRTPAARAALFAGIERILEKANFEALSDVQVDAAIRAANSHGLKVRLHPDRVERLDVWVRGPGEVERAFRTWRSPLRPVTRRLPVFRRLVVVAQLKNEPFVLLKLFKDIPAEDVEALLPHAEVEMNLLDRLMLIGGGAGTLGTTGYKVFQILTAAVAFSKLLIVLGVGMLTLATRSILGYRRARLNRDWQRTRHLYYQNLANNGAALHAILAMIMQEEIKESVLAYALCAAANIPIRSAADLREAADAFLAEKFDVQCAFDADDAIESLDRFDLWVDRGVFAVVPPAEALERLRRHWAARRSAGYHASCWDRVPADEGTLQA